MRFTLFMESICGLTVIPNFMAAIVSKNHGDYKLCIANCLMVFLLLGLTVCWDILRRSEKGNND